MPPYAQRLEQARLRAGMSKRALALAIAARTARSYDVERRALYKYLDGTEPEPDRAAVIADVLEAPELAIVQAPADRRRTRQAELEERVAELESLLNALTPRVDQLAAQVEALGKPARSKPAAASTKKRAAP